MIEMVCAGFGGQGILTSGLILAEAGMKLGKNVSWYPSYGSEMRGGTANCTVKFSEREIASPYARQIDILFSLNEPSIDKFEARLKPGGLLLTNSSIVPAGRKYRDDVRVIKVPVAEIAASYDNPRGANIVMMGTLAANSGLFDADALARMIDEYFSKKGKQNPKNALCFRAGADIH
ncbi:MAG: 2-oxoacid:acceptor oxidoreductase family protein [Clostridiales Family XIII bacterium]|jgi:2-oxoglutarate ferredoxin oxidoreductase subunit gamma|nr:2-oxoacid:acceptor oxidoreductase family protein [Clostridiales Family XIII bacterium]